MIQKAESLYWDNSKKEKREEKKQQWRRFQKKEYVSAK